MSAAATVYVVRHAETEWNTEGRRQGRSDSPLTLRGRSQAVAVARALAKLLHDVEGVTVECSPLGRARVTAQILCRELRLPNHALVTAPLLVELDHGAWEGLTPEEVDARFPGARAERERDKWRFVMPGGESYAAVHERSRRWLAARKPGETVVAVTHEMLSRTLRGAYASHSPNEMLALAHPHDRIYRLRGGACEEIRTAAAARAAGGA
jgi:2,3-bisphosphoglycerate-dependent phosphoglycerate mutase